MAELKSCPFCGSEKLKLDRKSKFAGCNGLDMRVEQHTYSVRCNVCHARGGAVGGKVLFGSSIFGKDISPSWATTDAELKEKAIEAWNTRTPQKEVEVVRCRNCIHFKTDTDYRKEHNRGCCEWDLTIKELRREERVICE